MAYADNNNTLFSFAMPTSDTTRVEFSLIENKKSGLLRGNVREFKETETYSGPTRNGFSVRIETPEKIEEYKKNFDKFFDEIKKML